MTRGRVPDWVAPYVGMPFKEKGRDRNGVDCWGLVRLVLAEQAALDLPAYAAGYEGTGRADAADIKRLVEGGRSDYVELPIEVARPLDVVLLATMGHPMHVGIVVAPGWMLHAEEGVGAVVEAYDGLRWQRRVLAIYRHRRLIGGT